MPDYQTDVYCGQDCRIFCRREQKKNYNRSDPDILKVRRIMREAEKRKKETNAQTMIEAIAEAERQQRMRAGLLIPKRRMDMK